MIDAMVRKLDSMQEADTANIPDYDQLRMILLAGKEEQPRDDFNRATKTLIEVKELMSNWKEDIERRVSLLEQTAKWINSESPVVGVDCQHKWDSGSCLKCGKPSPAVECEHEWKDCGDKYDLRQFCAKCVTYRFKGKEVKPYCPSSIHDSILKEVKCRHEFKPIADKFGMWICSKCNETKGEVKPKDEPTDGVCPKCGFVYCECVVCPASGMIQISREVAQEWLKAMLDINSQDMVDEIRKALEESK